MELIFLTLMFNKANLTSLEKNTCKTKTDCGLKFTELELCL